jgi:hypothetical protein
VAHDRIVPSAGRGAVLSPCGLYRYLLWRIARLDGPRALFIGINPSDADANIDDPTVLRFGWFATNAARCTGGFEVGNLYPYRTPYPSRLRYEHAEKIEGPSEALDYLFDAMERCTVLVACWGANADHRDAHRVRIVTEAAAKLGKTLHCLGMTKAGAPKHPLYLKGDTQLMQWANP